MSSTFFWIYFQDLISSPVLWLGFGMGVLCSALAILLAQVVADFVNALRSRA